MRPLIVANWKLNPQTLAEAKRLFDSVKKGMRKIKNAEVVICPPFVYLLELGVRNKELRIKFGAQDCFWEEKGAFTGEVSPLMLKNLGCQYIIVGHSERRRYFQETDEIINKKMIAALRIKLKPIFCIGETKEEKEKGKTQEVLSSQIKNGLKGITGKEIKNIIIAYEPVWAIGTGIASDIKNAWVVNLFIRKITKNLPVLYGGSVNSKNALGFIKEADFQGLLVGGASLNSKEFIQIIKNIIE